METQVYIKGFSKNTSKDQLRTFFNEYSSIEGVRIVKDFAFIDFKENDDAGKAVKEKDGCQFNGRKLTVQFAGKNKRRRGPQPDDQCRYCGKLGHWQKQCSKFLRQRRRRRRSYSSQSSQSSYRRRRRRHSSKRRYRDRSQESRSSSSSSSSSGSSSSESSSRSRSRQKKKYSKKY